MKLRFGPAGKPVSMKSGDILRIPSFLRSIGLDAMEYEAVKGVRIDEAKARMFGEEARKHGIMLSLHAPYFINLSSAKREVVEASVLRLIESVRAAHWMGAYVVVFHPGYYSGLDRREALERVIKNLEPVVEAILEFNDLWLGPETTGKTSQVGDLDEIIEICRSLNDEKEVAKPVVDWAHIYARSGGLFVKSVDDVIRVVERLEKELGEYAVRPLHSHFTKVEFNNHGEVRHRALSEKNYGPQFEHVCRGLVEVGIDSIIISESPLLELDSLKMKEICIDLCSSKCISD